MKQYIRHWVGLIRESVDDNSFEGFARNMYADEKDQIEAYEKICRLLEDVIEDVKCDIADENMIVASSGVYRDFAEELDYYNKELDRYGFELDIDDTNVNYVHGDAENTDVYFSLIVTDEDKLRNFLN